MNRRQKKGRIKRLNLTKDQQAIRKAIAKRKEQEAFALAWHRDWVRQQWAARREFRRIRELDKPKSGSETW